MADPGFDGMDVSIEERILAAFVVLLKADEDIAAEFAPILTLETPTRQAFERIAAGSMAVQPYQVKAADKPSGRSTIRVGLLVSAYLEAEQTEEDSNLLGLRLGNHIRKLAFSNPRLSDTEPLTMSAVEVGGAWPVTGTKPAAEKAGESAAITPGSKLSTTRSAPVASASTAGSSSEPATERFEAFRKRNRAPSSPASRAPVADQLRSGSPAPDSILITSAPASAKSRVQ